MLPWFALLSNLHPAVAVVSLRPTKVLECQMLGFAKLHTNKLSPKGITSTASKTSVIYVQTLGPPFLLPSHPYIRNRRKHLDDIAPWRFQRLGKVPCIAPAALGQIPLLWPKLELQVALYFRATNFRRMTNLQLLCPSGPHQPYPVIEDTLQ